MGALSTRFRHRIHLCADVSPKLCRREQRRHVIFLNRIDWLWNQRNEALAAHANVFIVVVRSVDREIVGTRAQTVGGVICHSVLSTGLPILARSRNCSKWFARILLARSESREIVSDEKSRQRSG